MLRPPASLKTVPSLLASSPPQTPSRPSAARGSARTVSPTLTLVDPAAFNSRIPPATEYEISCRESLFSNLSKRFVHINSTSATHLPHILLIVPQHPEPCPTPPIPFNCVPSLFWTPIRVAVNAKAIMPTASFIPPTGSISTPSLFRDNLLRNLKISVFC